MVRLSRSLLRVRCHPLALGDPTALPSFVEFVCLEILMTCEEPGAISQVCTSCPSIWLLRLRGWYASKVSLNSPWNWSHLITGNTTKFTQEGAQSREPLHLDLVSAENVGARAPCSPMPQLLQYFPCTLGWTDLFVATVFDRDIPWPSLCVPSGTGVIRLIRLNLWSAKENSNLLTMCGRRTCSHSIHQLLERASLPGQLYSIFKC